MISYITASDEETDHSLAWHTWQIRQSDETLTIKKNGLEIETDKSKVRLIETELSIPLSGNSQIKSVLVTIKPASYVAPGVVNLYAGPEKYIMKEDATDGCNIVESIDRRYYNVKFNNLLPIKDLENILGTYQNL